MPFNPNISSASPTVFGNKTPFGSDLGYLGDQASQVQQNMPTSATQYGRLHNMLKSYLGGQAVGAMAGPASSPYTPSVIYT